jgi:PTS system ascorbate-specific IIA component
VIGVVLIAHAPLASALAASAAHVYTCAPEVARAGVQVYDLQPDEDPEAALAHARRLVAAADSGAGVLVLTDVLGATPSNVAARLAQAGRVAVVAGVNLPMLLRALCYRQVSLEQAVAKAISGGTEGVRPVSFDAPACGGSGS